MKIAASVLAALFACSSLPALAAGPVILQQPDATAEVTGTELMLQAGLDRQTASQNGLAALVAESILRTPVNGTPLEDAVAANGGSITYAIDPRDVRFYLEGLGTSYAKLLDLFHTALAKPDFSAPTLAAARAALTAKIDQSQRAPLRVGIDMLNRAFYTDSAGMPPYGLPATLASFAGSDAQAFFKAHYLRADAVISCVGNVAAVPNSATAALADALAPGTSAPAKVGAAAGPASSTRELLARRDVSVPWLVAQYPAPDLQSKDFGAMLILTAFMQRTLADVSEVPAIATRSASARGVGAYYNFDARPANVIIYVDGGLGDPTRTFATALTVVNVLGRAKLGGDLKEMKGYAAGRLLEDTTTLQDRAWFAAVFASRGETGDYFARAIKAINATSASDLQRVASHYLGAPTIALVLPRTQSSLQSPTP